MKDKFNPDYIVSTGEVLGEHLEFHKMDLAKLRLASGLPVTLILDILDGDYPVTFDIAKRFEIVFGPPAGFWFEFDSQYWAARRLKCIQEEENNEKKV